MFCGLKGEKNEKWNKRDDMMILTKRGLTENIDGDDPKGDDFVFKTLRNRLFAVLHRSVLNFKRPTEMLRR